MLAAFRHAVENLEQHVDEVNALNVFPVPDGDTGTNMLATVKAALALLGVMDGELRLPLVPLSPPNREKLVQTLQACGVMP